MHTFRAAAAAPLLLASLIRSTGASTCYSGVNVFTARGTGEQPPNGLGIEGVHINAILDAIPGSNATVVEYPADFSNSSVPIGVQNGTREIETYLDACPTSKIVVMGYSQGAAVMGYVLNGANFTIAPDGTAQNYTVPPLATKYADQVVAIVFFGDPGFNINIGINSDEPYPCNVSSANPRTGALWESYGSRLEEWCNYSDFVCCSTGTTFAGHVSYFSSENGTITGDFVAAKYSAAASVTPSLSSSTLPVSTPLPRSSSKIRSSAASSTAAKSQSSAAVRSSAIVSSLSSPSVKASTISAAASRSSSKISSLTSSASSKGSIVSAASSIASSAASKASSMGSGSSFATKTSTLTSKTKSPAFPTLPTLPSLTFPSITLPTGWPKLGAWKARLQ